MAARPLTVLLALALLAPGLARAADFQHALVIVIDDVGVDKVGAYAADADNPDEDRPETPNIDMLAAAGVRFSAAWGSPVCSPFRATLYSGEYSYRNGIGTVISEGSGTALGTERDTLQKLAADSGVASGLFGKWHVGETSTTPDTATTETLDYAEYPIQTGFTWFAGNMDGQVQSYTNWLYTVSQPNSANSSGYQTTAVTSTVEATTRTTDDAVAWMEAQSATGTRRFAVVSYNLPHFTGSPSTRTWANGATACGESATSDQVVNFNLGMECLDTRLQALFERVPDLEETLVILVSDNGTDSLNTQGLFDEDDRGKNSPYEGGVRVPFLVADGAALQAALDNGGVLPEGGSWRVGAGSVVADATSGMDIYATVADFLDLSSSTCTPGETCGVHSQTLRSVLTGGPATRESTWTERFSPLAAGSYMGVAAVRQGDLKLILRVNTNTGACRDFEMYDVVNDRWEQSDLLYEPEWLAERAALLDLVDGHAAAMAESGVNWLPANPCDPCVVPEVWYDGIDSDCGGDDDFDQDGDGFLLGDDCDDEDALIYPGAPEVWYDGIDSDCEGDDDFDQDGDGFLLGDDCDDEDPLSYPGAADTWYDGIDSNCAGDDDYDQDGDGVVLGTDCDDEDALAYPGALDTWYDGIDSDCAGNDDFDQDADGVALGSDCDDTSAAVYPRAPDTSGDGIDSDCGGTDDDDDIGVDPDGDGSPIGEDCDDTDATIYPGAPDAWYDGIDSNCAGDDDYDQDADGVQLGTDCDDEDALTYPGAPDAWYDGIDSDCAYDDDFDQDADGVQLGSDCDDEDALTYPGAPDAWYDGIDSDCGGEDDFDQDADGVALATDCDDEEPAVFPGAPEACDGRDDDCDGVVDDPGSPNQPVWYADNDADTYGAGSPVYACAQPSGHAASSTDCDDASGTTYPGAEETCNDLDDDCDSLVDEAGVTGGVDWYVDADGDGYGDPDDVVVSCDVVAGRTDVGGDCADSSAASYPGAVERCDGIQNDCDIVGWTESDEDDEVWLEPSSGSWTSYSATWGAGVDGSPAVLTLPANGTLHVCDGTWFVRLTASATGILDIVGEGDAAVLDGGGTGSVVSVTGSGVDLLLDGLTLTGGTGSGSPVRGGGLRVTSGLVSVTDSVLTGNSASTGGGLSVTGGTVSVSNSEVSANVSSNSGGGIFHNGGSLALSGVDILDNDAVNGGGFYYQSGTLSASGLLVDGNYASTAGGGVRASTTATFSTSTFSNNEAPSGGALYYAGSSGTLTLSSSLATGNKATAGYGGGVYLYGGALVATGSTSGTYGFTANTATTGGGGVYLRTRGTGTVFTATTCDFGTTTANNSPQDILYVSTTYNRNNNVTLSCSSGTCR